MIEYDFKYLDSGVLLRDALQYAARGKKVFPLTPCYNQTDDAGKRPAVKNGFKSATTDQATITKWWSMDPRYNVGMPTGPENGLLVIDVDIKPGEKDGMASLKQLEAQCGKLPETLTATTGSGGKHYFFRYPEGHEISSNQSEVGAWIDIRATGGYVVVPPSMHKCGNVYKWDNPGQQPADLPEAWIKAIETAKGSKIPKQRKERKAAAGGELDWNAPIGDGKPPFVLPDSIPEGGRNGTLCSYAGQLWARGVDAEAVLAKVQEANTERCKPPLSEGDVQKIVQSVTKRYQQGQPTQLPTFDPAAAPAGFIPPKENTDVGNSDAFIANYGKDLRYTGGQRDGRWYAWDGKHYAESWAAVQELAKAYGLQLLELAQAQVRAAVANGEEPKRYQQLEKFALATRGVYGIRSIMQLAASKVHTAEREFDHNPWLLNTPGGMVDLKTGNLLPHDRAECCRNITAADPTTAAAERASGAASKWLEFVDLVTAGDVELANYLQCVIGSALIGKPLVEGFYIAYGEGGNGKSTFFNAITRVLGRGYAGSIDPEVLTVGYKRDRQNGLTALVGKRLVIAPESEEQARLSSATTKRVASTDAMTVKHLYADPETVDPSHSLFMFTNHLPVVSSRDNGTWRRLRVVPFEVPMPKGPENVPDYAAVLAAECPGTVLQWCIDGAVQFVANGCRIPDCTAVELATRAWKDSNDIVAMFLADAVEDTGNDGDFVPAVQMHKAFCAWCHDRGRIGLTRAELGERLEALGYTIQINKRVIQYRGVRLLERIS